MAATKDVTASPSNVAAALSQRSANDVIFTAESSVESKGNTRGRGGGILALLESFVSLRRVLPSESCVRFGSDLVDHLLIRNRVGVLTIVWYLVALAGIALFIQPCVKSVEACGS